jgi:peptidoglycan/xylan/chitin deacetylase (PgdA/CDA1 family)
VLTVRNRNLPYLARRVRSVTGRYGVGPAKAKARVRRCITTLEPHGVLPTFATPGRVIDGDPGFFRELSEAGAELAVHGYDHVSFRDLTPAGAREQFERALNAFTHAGIPCDGFRCPYLSWTPELHAALPAAAFVYSSNEAIAWSLPAAEAAGAVFEQFGRFYGATPAERVVSTPRRVDGLVEVPASIPDDLQLCDGLALGEDGLRSAWVDILQQVHARGELFAPLFHPESFDLLRPAVEELLTAAGACRPAMWRTQLRDVARWWVEKDGFSTSLVRHDDGLRLELHCSDRATVLVRDWEPSDAARPWDGRWSALERRSVPIAAGPRPFVGAVGLEPVTVAFLRDQGYVVDDGEDARRCALVLTPAELPDSPVALIDRIERSHGALIRFSRWPDGAKSAFCFAGDLDALSLRDYAGRLDPRRRRARR